MGRRSFSDQERDSSLVHVGVPIKGRKLVQYQEGDHAHPKYKMGWHFIAG